MPIESYEGVRGVLYATFERRNFPSIFFSPLFGGRGFSYIVDGRGDIILAPEKREEAVFKDSANLFSANGKIDARYDGSRHSMKNDMAARKSGSFKYDVRGETRYLNYASLGVNDWYLVSVIPSSVLLERLGDFVNISVFFGEMIFALLTMIGAITYFILRRQMQETNVAKESLKALTSNIPGGVSRCLPDSGLTITDISDGYLSILECGREDFHLHYQDSFAMTIHPEDRERVLKMISEQTGDDYILSLEYRIITAKGNIKWILDRGHQVKERGGRFFYYHVVLDNTESKLNSDALALSEERYRIVTENADECLFDWNVLNDVIYFSPAYQKRFGDRELHQAANADDREILDSFFSEVLSGHEGLHQADLRMGTIEGDYIWCRVQGTTIVDSSCSVVRVVGIVKDISAQVREREELVMQAQTDSLTGLCDKGTTQTLIADYLALSSPDKTHAVFICDIDNFKMVNDTFGHLYGDTILGDLASKLRSTFRGTDVVGRIGGDEFMILMKDVPSLALIHSKALEIRAAFQQNYERFSSSGSIGIAIFPQDGTGFNELYQRADMALYSAKQNGKNRYMLYEDVDNPGDVLEKARLCNLKTQPDQPQGQKSYSDNITEYVFKILYTMNDFEEAVNLALSVACRYFNMSRGYIFEYDVSRTMLGCTFEYCQSGVEPIIGNYPMRPAEQYPLFIKHFDESDVFFLNSLDDVCDPAYREQLGGEGVVNMLQCAFKDKGIRFGALGFDDCKKEGHRPTSKEIETLSLLADIIGSYILKERSQKMLSANFQIQESILNSLRQWVFVVNQNWEFIYFNDELRRFFPDAELGKKCFAVLQGRDTACENCPLTEMRKTGSSARTMRSCFTKSGFSATVNATAIRRNGEEDIYTFCALDIRKES
ncbi:MAG: diguanylate cyclase [Synergistaceae bacterium]|nr:diguanylate cyclase [Synergistaceae bacterium]